MGDDSISKRRGTNAICTQGVVVRAEFSAQRLYDVTTRLYPSSGTRRTLDAVAIEPTAPGIEHRALSFDDQNVLDRCRPGNTITTALHPLTPTSGGLSTLPATAKGG